MSRRSIGNPLSQTCALKVRVFPWVIQFIAIYTFTLFWIYYAIVKRNFTKPDWEAALPGLDRTPALAFTTGAHMVCGAISLLLGPLQLISYIRRQIPYLHRWPGRACCICCMLSSIFGLMFIALKGKLVVSSLDVGT